MSEVPTEVTGQHNSHHTPLLYSNIHPPCLCCVLVLQLNLRNQHMFIAPERRKKAMINFDLLYGQQVFRFRFRYSTASTFEPCWQYEGLC